MTDPLAIIEPIYKEQPDLKRLLLVHSGLVARKALAIADAKGLEVDRDFVREAAMLHDIGIISTDAPGIMCRGTLPYICHGVEGSRMLGELGLLRHALVCERHTGAGLTVADIDSQALPLPRRDMCPQSLEEKLICYADKFYSKSGDPTAEKSLERVRRSMLKFGPEAAARFEALHALFG